MLKPIEFKGQNVVYAQDQPEYIPLPGYKVPSRVVEGNFVSCWKPTFWDRFRILFGAKLWLEQWTFHNDLQPVKLTVDKNETIVPK